MPLYSPFLLVSFEDLCVFCSPMLSLLYQAHSVLVNILTL